MSKILFKFIHCTQHVESRNFPLAILIMWVTNARLNMELFEKLCGKYEYVYLYCLTEKKRKKKGILLNKIK